MRLILLRNVVFPAALIVLSLLHGGCAHDAAAKNHGAEQRKSGTISGKVLDGGGKGIEKARVSLASAHGESLTGPDGSFLFANMSAGTYAVIAKAAGFYPDYRYARVQGGQITELPIVLKKEPRAASP